MSNFTELELAFLHSQRLGRLATVNAAGEPHVVPLTFRHNAELDTLDLFGMGMAKSKKYRDVGRTGVAAFVVDDAEGQWRIRASKCVAGPNSSPLARKRSTNASTTSSSASTRNASSAGASTPIPTIPTAAAWGEGWARGQPSPHFDSPLPPIGRGERELAWLRSLPMGKGIRKRSVNDTPVQRELRRRATPAEEILWESLRDRKLIGLKFRRQHGFGPFVLDFFSAAHKLVIELDGAIHDSQVEQDAYRTEYLAQYGYRVIRFRNEEVLHDLPSVLDRIRREVASGSQPLRDKFPSPLPIGGRGEGSGEG
ncbi:MAG: DUF559 domain-containing protein [Thermomicrobiales bacterium]